MMNMKLLQTRCIALLICLIGLLSAHAEKIWVNGFEYEFEGNEATVTNCNLSGDIVIPSKVTYDGITYSVTTIGKLAFYCNHQVTSIRMPNTVTTIKNNAFIYASVLRIVYIPSSIETIDGAIFYDNASLTTLYCMAPVPPYPYDGTAGPIESLVDLYVPSGSLDAYQSAPYWEHFRNIYPFDTWDFVEDGVYYHIIGDDCVSVIYGEPGLGSYSGSVVIPETVIHNGVSYHVTEIAASAFAYSGNLISLSIPVTLNSIGNEAFTGCLIQSLIITGSGAWTAGNLNLNLNELFIDSGVTSITGLKVEASNVYSLATNPPVCDEFTFMSYEGALHVPPTSFSAYFTAPYWSNFLNTTGDADFAWPTSVQLSQSNALLEIGEQFELSATVFPSGTSYNTITWASSDVNVATVSDGVITALSAGECDIIATSLTVMAKCHIVVVEKKIYITLDKHTSSVLPNHMIMLTPTLSPISTDISVSSSNPAVAVARIAGDKVQVAGISEGTTTIIVNSVDGYAFPDSCVVTVFTEVGDLNCDGYVTIADVTALINYLLYGDDSAINVANGDTNKDESISISDVTTLIEYLLRGIWPWEMGQNHVSNVEKFSMIPVDIDTFMMGNE